MDKLTRMISVTILASYWIITMYKYQLLGITQRNTLLIALGSLLAIVVYKVYKKENSAEGEGLK